jgi:predicted nucleotidyltransferase
MIEDITVSSLAENRGISYASARVTLARLQKRHEVIRVGWGKYKWLDPETRAKLEYLHSKNKKLFDLIVALYREIPRLKMILIFGSQARGDADRLSDIDVLVVSDVGWRLQERRALQERLSTMLRKHVEIKVISEDQYRKWLMLEPKMRFWLREGIIFDEHGLSREIYPISKIGLLEALSFADLQLELSRGRDEATHLFAAFKELLTLKHVLNLSYDTLKLKLEMQDLLGRNLCSKLRAISKGKKLKLSRQEISTLKRAVNKLYPVVAKEVRALGENESDLYLRRNIL